MSRVIQLPHAAEGLGPRGAHALEPDGSFGEPTIRTSAVYVVYTTVDETFAALRVADDFAKALGVPVTVVHFRTVPYALPVDGPSGISPIETQEFVERLRAEGMEVRLRVYMCRDERRTMPFAFKPHSLIVVAGRRSWWPTPAERRRRMLEAAGHFVMFVDASEHGTAGLRDGQDPATERTAAAEESSHA